LPAATASRARNPGRAVTLIWCPTASVVRTDGRMGSINVPQFAGDRIVAFHTVTNPDKLAFAARQTI
jgi:hypothetical protein